MANPFLGGGIPVLSANQIRNIKDRYRHEIGRSLHYHLTVATEQLRKTGNNLIVFGEPIPAPEGLIISMTVDGPNTFILTTDGEKFNMATISSTTKLKLIEHLENKNA